MCLTPVQGSPLPKLEKAFAMRHVILNLHGLGTPEHALSAGEANYWVPATLLEAAINTAAQHADRVQTRFTFDDGNLSDLKIGAPMLSAAGHQAMFFVLSARIGQPHYLSGNDIQTLQDMGHIIGHHGADHVDWTTLDDAGFKHELTQARTRIEAETAKPVLETAIPFGRYNANVLRHLKTAGFSHAYSSDGGAVTGGGQPISRTSLTAGMTPESLDNILLGREPLKHKLRRSLAVAIKKRI